VEKHSEFLFEINVLSISSVVDFLFPQESIFSRKVLLMRAVTSASLPLPMPSQMKP
jgi:hypothetical protein